MTEKILIVDDDQASRWLICKHMEKLKVQFDCASSGREALECLSNFRYSVILMDISMPELDGYATTRAIRARERESLDYFAPIIAVTNYPDLQLCFDAGITECLAKPLDLQKLEAILAKFIKVER